MNIKQRYLGGNHIMPISSAVKIFGLLTIGLLLATPARANFCDECIVTTDPVPADWEDQEKATTRKPDNLTPEEIAKTLVLSSNVARVGYDFSDAIIAKWETPLRVRIVGVDGKDLPLDQQPGDIIAGFLQRLSRDTDIPISITTQEKKDNNVSIVAGVLPSNSSSEVQRTLNNGSVVGTQAPFVVADDFASIQGVPSMNAVSRTLAGAWLNKSDDNGRWFSNATFDIGTQQSLHTIAGTYRVGAEIKACALILNHGKASERNMASIVLRLSRDMPDCLGMDAGRVGALYPDRDIRLKMSSANALHQRYFLKLLYLSTKAGMSAESAEEAAAEHINSK